MDAQLDVQFQRIESALEKLISSITTYNPSVPAAEELLQANDDLSDGLDTLTEHQTNHLRILSLRQTVASLDAQVKNGLTQLAEARKELTNASLTAPADNSRDVPFNELIKYAQRISKYSVPPTYRPPLPVPLARKEVNGTKRIVPVMIEDTKPATNGTPATAQPGTTPATTDGAGAPADGVATSPVQVAPTETEEDRGVGWATLSEDQKAWLDSVARLQYVPWPSDNEVKSGALARIQAMQGQGMDPAGMTKSAAELQEEARAKEEREQRELAELHERQRRGSAVGRRPEVSRPEGNADFGLDLYDPDEG